MGQVAMATGRDCRQTMPTGGAGSPSGGRPSGMRVEDATGAWTVPTLHGCPLGVDEASEGRTNGIWRVEGGGDWVCGNGCKIKKSDAFYQINETIQGTCVNSTRCWQVSCKEGGDYVGEW